MKSAAVKEFWHCGWCNKLTKENSKNGYCQRCFESKLVLYVESSALLEERARSEKLVNSVKRLKEVRDKVMNEEMYDGDLDNAIIDVLLALKAYSKENGSGE